jgi:aminoglycoside 3-N-acetyltransferase
VTGADIAAGLRRLGLAAGDRVQVHSSLKSFGRVEGGPRTVIEALQEVVTPAGTVMMPAFNQLRCYDEEGSGLFDPTETPAVTGAVTDAFWRMPEVRRSWNPSHSFAAWGDKADEYTREHHRRLTCGPGSPLGLLAADGGWALLLGVTCRANTYHHVVEMTLKAPCLGRRTLEVPMRLPDGRVVPARCWNWRERGCPIDDRAHYADLLAERGLWRQTRVGDCLATCFRLSDCFEVVAELLRDGFGDAPPCSRCPIRPRSDPRNVESDWDEENHRLKPDSEAWRY